MKSKIELSNATLRLPLDVKAWLEMRATENCRSLNTEVIYMIKTAMAADQAKAAGA